MGVAVAFGVGLGIGWLLGVGFSKPSQQVNNYTINNYTINNYTIDKGYGKCIIPCCVCAGR